MNKFHKKFSTSILKKKDFYHVKINNNFLKTPHGNTFFVPSKNIAKEVFKYFSAKLNTNLNISVKLSIITFLILLKDSKIIDTNSDNAPPIVIPTLLNTCTIGTIKKL